MANRLGIDETLARDLLSDTRARLGGRAYFIRATAFSLAARAPAGKMVPRRLLQKAFRSFLDPLLGSPAAMNAFVSRSRMPDDRCAGLLRESLETD